MNNLITTYINPPIPPRNHDWCAFRDGTEESGPVGWGSTEEAAIADLEQQEEDAS